MQKIDALFICSFRAVIVGLMVQLFCLKETKAQYPGIENDIARYRKGVLIVHAMPGDKVIVEQVSHEFWFGCAISNGLVGGSMPENDVRQYKEKFLENFNSAVTENAVKWPNMEPRRGEVNYTVVDGILEWTEQNHIPLRAHNLFWGISKFVQPWVKDLNDDDLRKTLQNRAETITKRYQGRFAEMTSTMRWFMEIIMKIASVPR